MRKRKKKKKRIKGRKGEREKERKRSRECTKFYQEKIVYIHTYMYYTVLLEIFLLKYTGLLLIHFGTK